MVYTVETASGPWPNELAHIGEALESAGYTKKVSARLKNGLIRANLLTIDALLSLNA